MNLPIRKMLRNVLLPKNVIEKGNEPIYLEADRKSA